MSKKTGFIIPFAMLLLHFSSAAQESMLQDVSYTYLQQLIDTAKKYYPKMKVYDKRIENAATDVKKAKLGWFDVANFSLLYSPNNSTTLVNPSFLNGYQVGLFVNVGSVLQKPSVIKHAKGDLEITKAEKEEYEVNIQALVTQRYFLYVQAKSLLRVKTQAVLDIEGTMEQMKYKFEKGEETLESYNKYMVSYDDRVQAKIESEASLLIAKSNLEELVGLKLEQIK
ncbi:TolC family protein [Panacibacter ginsenosidivorans]|uniref:TolC family protein n=1 Tax=Panacibacter ginsenosidivorans TaxID=1813871 RepID=A0A5B8V5Z0_9BACT|nr:TolC family protein [Panacibacter ginsenosidivorans]QEC66642.1 TolC family protein [Panacibacter ginsenosidivorans]